MNAERPCPECGQMCKSASGLASHMKRHPDRTVPASLSIAVAVAQDLAGVDAPAGLKASALLIAQTLDETSSARDRATLVKELRATLAAVGVEAAAQKKTIDNVDQLAARRASRIAKAAGSSPSGG